MGIICVMNAMQCNCLIVAVLDVVQWRNAGLDVIIKLLRARACVDRLDEFEF